ncbi:MAG: hypothetical protein COV80_03670 [Parcubacteria group bacterium CG11_big_fil_rev_8_21_14_0_20_48_46]|nr:MAG: hypothetical protein COZ99_04135 [Parcubacteria group bacterium CG_4_8_14_3_um_filter_48_16]PIZ77927.1 MAG: hypothetical protein COY03_01090 [bacterium CG_4_10_14_0_2_um_filter_48_144]PJC39984.1 MAG: hypothetical protein CO043_01300 [Parcubacteria group bacterium CG_4_9_14_0_2_um_filter_48_40]PJE52495.1 MAG: hypothetical protein COV80_03670 [Parcubacteria group bacterium CG11_big_fil_rev_8_21_14_0_20_48_46]
MKFFRNKIVKKFLPTIGCLLLIFIVWQGLKRVPMEGDWQEQLEVISSAEFNGDSVMVKNVRNFRYFPTEKDMHPAYYDKTYDLNQIKKVWYVTEPFNENQSAAHTFVSFEFNNGDFLAISIEARKTKDQIYSIWKGMLRTYPLVYIAADERDVLLLRANIRKDRVYVYPVKLEKPENGRLILVDMLTRMNELVSTKPAWYNTLFANCTSSIAKHVNKITPGRISIFSWQLWLTASADELALEHRLIDTDLPIEQAREKYSVNEDSERVGDIPNYSTQIRNFKD